MSISDLTSPSQTYRTVNALSGAEEATSPIVRSRRLVPPLKLRKGTHHRSNFCGERVVFCEVRMSAILKKNGLVLAYIFAFFLKGGLFLHT